jgi:hypothetical protein
MLLVPHRNAVNARPGDVDGFRYRGIHVSNVGLEVIQTQGKETHTEISLKGTLQIFGSLCKAIEKDTGLAKLDWLKERKSLNVVPVGVGDEKVNFNGLFTGEQLLPKGPNARARVDDDSNSVLEINFQTGRIAPVPEGVRSRHCNGSPDSPKRNFHDFLVTGF